MHEGLVFSGVALSDRAVYSDHRVPCRMVVPRAEMAGPRAAYSRP